LYHSIGENGPKAGNGRAIAVTDFELKWSRRYTPEGSGCRLTVAKPHLTITYKLPKPSQKLSTEVIARWERFSQGVERHERVHGEMIVETVRKIRATTLGLHMENDPDCK